MTLCLCTKSLWYMHNETLNTWTHLICGLYYIYQLILLAHNRAPYNELSADSSRVIQAATCVGCIACMLSSSVYHLYNSLSREHYICLLKLDLIGIGLKISGLAVALIYTGFHTISDLGRPLSLILAALMASNLLLQLTPCYMHEKYESHRLVFYVGLITSLFVIAVAWTTWVATPVELDLFLSRVILSFLYIGAGFWFYSSGWPECRHSGYWVQMLFQGHVWWHLLVWLNGYTLYWLLFDALKHVESGTD